MFYLLKTACLGYRLSKAKGKSILRKHVKEMFWKAEGFCFDISDQGFCFCFETKSVLMEIYRTQTKI